MAQEPASIPRDLNLPPSKDYRFLRQEGIDIAQELSGEVWTDYNVHDPGVTILEHLCLALTELAYKSGMSIEDILYAERPEPFNSEDNAFFTPELVFPCSPITLMDYRRALVDQLYPKVRNAWITPLESGAFGVNVAGLYRISLMLDDEHLKSEAEAKDEIYREFNKYRNLTEDVEVINVLRPLEISVRGNLRIDPAYLVEDVIANILHQLSIAINPPVKFKSRKELEADGLSVDEVFDGPMPKHGFVDPASLKESGLKPDWQISESSKFINILREIEGVENVSGFEIGVYIDKFKLPKGYRLIEKFKGDDEHDGYYLTINAEKLPRGHKIKDIKKPRRDLPEDFYLVREEEMIPFGFYPRLDTKAILNQHLFSCSVEGLEYDYNIETISKSLERIEAEQLVRYQHPIVYPPHRPRSNRTAKELSYYYSIQHHFPEVYGIGPFGVGKNRPVEHRTHARNLKAYLMFFEQIMADYLTQLTEFFRLFSLSEDTPSTYFHQLPSIPNEHLVFNEDQGNVLTFVEKISSYFDPVGDRRNRALDHLLARFGEEFLSASYSALTRNTIEESQVKYEEEMIKAKIKFLRKISELTRDRGRGENYLALGSSTGGDGALIHRNALQKRLALIFNMKDYMQMYLSESVRNADGISFTRGKAAPKKYRGKSAFTFTAEQQDILSIILREGLSRDNFAITENFKKKGQYQVFFGPTAGFQGGSDPVFAADSFEKCEAAITALIRRIRELNAESEGFHMIEHVLLRPVGRVMHTFFLVQEGRVFLETPVMEQEDFENDFRDMLLKRGFESNNYVITGNMEEGYTLVLTEEDGSIIAFKEGYIDEDSAVRERDRIIFLLPRLEENDPAIEIRKEQYIPKGALLADDFYSLQISVILPAWPVRFRNDKFRALFEQFVKLNVPAHSTLDTYWIDLAEMSDFEKIYNEWRNEKAKVHPKQPWLDELSWSMVILLKYFADPNDPLVIKEMPALRDKHGLSMKFVSDGE